ncbi:MAG: hypothetical protein GTO51_01985 [Candidatus Latescibacteria bacterium]|nr:hypothetical protein [Candidatus Latescibacterota bacterium]NIM64743.1 hypothetical protein [Candidatus Latescibacterota bacterium]NIO01253.1 hypothetical protein [Candidatus Latescibacterota bacterium]NIO27638.1 hypothetical protein [Candidatus Latescibacterota bacterium]NIO55170.1 hypothetical protein [Candidatus Latescibacterota bacterium]
MSRLLPLALIPLLIFAPETSRADSYFQQFVHYTIQARLDTENHMLIGTEEILYKNNSPDTLRQFYLHLYPNAFRNEDSALQRSYRQRYNVNLFNIPKAHRGFLDIESMSVNGSPVIPEIDDTIARIDLIQPLPPGESMTVILSFREKIRKHLGRAGYRGKQYDLAQWYPKVVVYDEKGFHPDKFEAFGEFYGEFGTFDVYLEIPHDYAVAATGLVQEGDPGWNINRAGKTSNSNKKQTGTYKTVHFHAEKVHDFAWSASPDFVVQDTTWNGVKIMSFFKRGNKKWKDTTLVHGVRALQWLSKKVGPYPYPQLSIVQALMSGGMEYPMIVLDGKVSEGLVLHEVGHIYFYGIFANDERAEAWLDEGFTSFQTGWYLEDRYGPWGKKHEWSFYEKITPQYTILEDAHRSLFPILRKGYGERLATTAEDFKNSYYTTVYVKGALFFNALRYVVGEEAFDRILKTYYERWKFKHVNEERFREVCEESSGLELGWFFEEWLHTRKKCDYRLDKIKTVRRKDEKGYRADVEIKRLGDIVMPLSLEFTLEDGSKRTYRIEGRLRTIKESFELPQKPKRAALNPQNEIMDLNLSDNFIPRRRDLQFDWPNNYYYPEDAYQIRYRPGIWYNDIDELKAGFLFQGSYMNEKAKRRLGVYYGLESERVDFSISLEKPIRLFGNNGSMSLSGYKMEGRNDITISLFLGRRKTLIHPPSHDFTIGFNFHELRNKRYVVDTEAYEEEPDVGPFINYVVDPQFDILSSRLTANLKLGRDWGGAKFDYERLATTVTFKTRAGWIPVSAGLRFFLGLVGGQMPLQQKFFLAGGGPLAQEQRFFLRSPGAIWEDLNYHQAGHGNLRGYLPGDFGVNRLFALNFEVGTQLPLGFLKKISGGIIHRVHWAGFVDLGEIMDKENPNALSARVQSLTDSGILDATLIDAGLGIRGELRFPFYNLGFRLDFPFFVNHPEVNGETDELRYRYVFSLDAAF